MRKPFAAAYLVLAAMSAATSAGSCRYDGLYFTVIVFITVRCGDITAKTDAARLMVTGQMIADLLPGKG